MPSKSKSTLFIFAHQDDEFAAQQLIEDSLRQGYQVKCVFTTQAPDSGLNAQRNMESLNVLRRLGVESNDVTFIGERLGIPDGQLLYHLTEFSLWVEGYLSQLTPECVWVPAWEGGHPDHDASHAVTVEVASRLAVKPTVRQFPLYNALGCPGPFFRVMHPLPDNGDTSPYRVPWANRLRHLMNCLLYPTQFKSWLGLMPFVTVKLLGGILCTQATSTVRTTERPHKGRLYYESRGFSTWEEFNQHLSSWRAGL